MAWWGWLAAAPLLFMVLASFRGVRETPIEDDEFWRLFRGLCLAAAIEASCILALAMVLLAATGRPIFT